MPGLPQPSGVAGAAGEPANGQGVAAQMLTFQGAFPGQSHAVWGDLQPLGQKWVGTWVGDLWPRPMLTRR